MTWNEALNKAVQSGEAKMETIVANTVEPTDFTFPKNLFTVESQAELNNVLHRPQDICPGDCMHCKHFHKAMRVVKTAATEQNIVITLTENTDEPLVRYYPFQVWCEECSDGENNDFFECCDWAARHAKGRHNTNV